ncbi:sperm acrosome membrane-associated protein 4-like [Lissotriton helveticus]
MNRALLLALAALLCFSLGEAAIETRKCLKCSFTLGNIPCYTTTEVCEPGEVCATITGHASNHQLITKKKCVEFEKCGTHESVVNIGINYTTSVECCEGDFCNSGAAGLARPSLLLSLAVWIVCLAWLL